MSLHYPGVRSLSDDQLMSVVHELVDVDRRTTANLLVLLDEVQARDLHLKEGSANLFAWCVEVLGFSEGKTATYLWAMQKVRRFPAALEMLADGRLNLSGLRVIGPHLSEENVAGRLAEATGKSKRQLEELVACWSPRPDVPSQVRKLPPRRETATPKAAADEGGWKLEQPRPAKVEPLSEERYKVEVTFDAKARARLDEAKALSGEDEAVVLAQALELFIAHKRKKMSAQTDKPRPAKVTPIAESEEVAKPKNRTRAIPAAVKRAVVERDGARCAFVGTRGRCKQTRHLQFHHIDPYATGGGHTVDNISMRCRAHNLMHGRDELGAGFVARKVAEQKARLKKRRPRAPTSS